MRKMRTMTLITLFGVWSLVLGCKCPLCVLSVPLKHDRITLNKSKCHPSSSVAAVKKLYPPGGSVYSVMSGSLCDNTINCFE